MATIVLTTVGTLVGGPIGGAVGAILGQSLDQALFAPKPRQGPRLGDLAVQTSSYGTQLPKIFGTMRVAGTVVWATDLVETRTSSGGGKGRPKSVGYSYAANFAVALSARRAGAVRRIWADGKLLRGAEADFKTKVGGFRFYSGDDDQPVDPLIASAEGAGLCPAYRGLAYAVFEELQLEEYGNRIPSLSFEIEADAEPVSIAAIAEAISGGVVKGGATPALAGYAASGDSMRSAIQTVTEPLALTLRDSGGVLTLGLDAAAPATVAAEAGTAEAEVSRRAETSIAAEVALSYYDPARDHQAGLQRAMRDTPALRAERIGLPAAVDAQQAKQFAEGRLAALWAARTSAKLRLGWRQIGLKPGSAVALESEPGLWRIERQLIGPMTIDLELIRLPLLAGQTPPAASAGRQVAEPDQVHGPTTLRLFDIPIAPDAAAPSVVAVASGTGPGWRRALLTASFDGGASWTDIGPTAAPGVIGRAVGALGPASSAVLDLANGVEVELLHESMAIEAREDAALADGANFAVIGAELVQFGCVERVSERLYRLSRLLRGRRGTEWAAATHGPDEAFALLDASSILTIAAPSAAVGSEARLVAVGVGDDAAGVAASCPVTGEAVRPPSPVHFSAVPDGAGGLEAAWTRRSRAGWTWTSGGDVPLSEERERYRVSLTCAGAQRDFEVSEPRLALSADELRELALVPPLAISVVQIGTHASSRAATATFA